MEAREPADGDIEKFESLSEGDEVSFFEWPVEPLTVLGREEDEEFGEVVRLKVEGRDAYIYEVDGSLWNYSPEYEGDNNPYPVQSLRVS